MFKVHLSEENIDGVIILRIVGSLTIAALHEIEARFDEIAEAHGARVVADIERVDALTTPAISLMLRTARAVARNGGRMIFARARPSIARMFACCRLDLVLELVDDFDAALTMAQESGPIGRFGCFAISQTASALSLK